MKACKVCEEIKAANDFYAHGGLICKKCAGKQSVERRKKDPRQLEKIKTYAKEYKQRAEVKEKSRERDRIRTEVRKNNQEWKNRRKELTCMYGKRTNNGKRTIQKKFMKKHVDTKLLKLRLCQNG